MLTSLCLCALVTGPVRPPEPSGDTFVRSVQSRIDDLGKSSGTAVAIAPLATSTKGRPISIIRLGSPAAGAAPAAVLLVAGADGRHRTGVDVALGLCEAVVRTSPPWLKSRTVYVVPCLNPDAFAAPGPVADFGRLPFDDDADHDRRVAEDPAEDLDNDGLILTMRLKNPAPSTGLTATHVEDPDEPRLLRPADAAKGERPIYALLPEGSDNDGDGTFNEDGRGGSAGGGIDLDMNWPAHWPQFKDGAGTRPLQTPETLGLAQWCLAHDELAAVVIFGRHDTLVSIPEAGKMDASGQVPVGIENDDKPLYEAISTSFKDITGITECPRYDTAGSFAAWAYTTLGIPAFSTPVWVRSDLVKEDKRFKPPAPPPVPQPTPIADIPNPPSDASKTEEPKKEDKPKRRDPKNDDQKWLRYFDDLAEGSPRGFVAWKPFHHPQLCELEVGGFVPQARMNAPAAHVPHLVEQQAAFLAEVLERLPAIDATPFLSRSGSSLWKLSARITNTGSMPTRAAIAAKADRVLPLSATLSIDPASLIVGRKKQSIDRLTTGGPSATFEPSWTFRAPEGTEVTITISDPIVGGRILTVKLADANPEASR